jgi:hypothetical protein
MNLSRVKSLMAGKTKSNPCIKGFHLSLTAPQRRSNTLFYIVDWLPPDFGAVGQYAMIFSRELVKGGRNVCLVGLTSGEGKIERELFDHGNVLEIRRLPARRYNKTNLAGRLIWSLRTNFKLSYMVFRDGRSRGAEILFTGSPPFMLFFAFVLKWLRSARLTYRITDFYPEVLVAAWGRRPLPIIPLLWVTWFLRKRVDRFQALGEDQRQLLASGGVASERITVKRDISPISFSNAVKLAEIPPELVGRRILLYSGNYGVAHEIDTVVEGLIRHNREGGGSFALWLNASGSSVEAVLRRLSAARVPFAYTQPVALDQLPSLLLTADAHLITLRPEFSGLVLPSKLYGCLKSGRPILFVGPKSSDVHLLSSRVGPSLYEHVKPGDVTAFAAALDRLAWKGLQAPSDVNHVTS